MLFIKNKKPQVTVKGYIETLVANSGGRQSVAVFQCCPLSARRQRTFPEGIRPDLAPVRAYLPAYRNLMVLYNV